MDVAQPDGSSRPGRCRSPHMTLYGESSDQFRPKPRAATLIAFSAATTILAGWLGSLLNSTIGLAAVGLRLAGEAGFPLLLAPAGTALLPGTEALSEDVRLAIAPLILIVLALILMTVWPSGGGLGSRMSTLLVARTFALSALTGSLTLSPADWLAGELTASGVWRPAIALSSLLLLWRGEIAMRNLLGAVFDTSTPARRLRVWLLASLPQYVIWGVLGTLQMSAAAWWTAVYALVVSVLAATAGTSRVEWQRLDRPRLVEDTIIAVASALLISIVGYWTFGAPALRHPRHAVIFATDPIARRVPLEAVQLTDSTPIEETTPSGTTPAEGEEPKNVIEIRWSDPEKEKARKEAESRREQEAPPPAP